MFILILSDIVILIVSLIMTTSACLYKHSYSLFSIDCSSVFKLAWWKEKKKKKKKKEVEKERIELTKRSNRIDKQIYIRHSLLLLSNAFNLKYFIDRNATSTTIFTTENYSCFLSLDR
jgi:hypothetical protein